MSETQNIHLPHLLELCATADVDVGCATKVDKGGVSFAVFNIDNQFYVTDDACTHGPGSLSEGYIEGDVIECDFHNGAFNIRTGEVVTPPCMIPLRTYEVHTVDGKVYIDPSKHALAVNPIKQCPKQNPA